MSIANLFPRSRPEKSSGEPIAEKIIIIILTEGKPFIQEEMDSDLCLPVLTLHTPVPLHCLLAHP
jgi:hypothetical protein